MSLCYSAMKDHLTTGINNNHMTPNQRQYLNHMEEEHFGTQSNANVPYVEPTQVRPFLIKVHYQRGKKIWTDLFVTRTVHATSYTAARKMVEDAGYTLA